MSLAVIGLNYAPEVTGIAVYTTGLAEAIAAEGEEVRVITGYPHYPGWHTFDGYTGFTRHEQVAGVNVKRVRHHVPAHPRLANRLVMELEFGVRALFSRWGRPDAVVLITPALFATGLAALRARLSGVETCMWVQDIYSLGIAQTGAGGRWMSRLSRLVERSILRSADSVVVIHERFKDYLVDELQVKPERIGVVPNWCHVDDEVGRDRPAVRARYGWAEDDIVVLHAGNMGAKQGLENVVHASVEADRRGSRVRFVLLGDGNRREALEQMGGNPRLQIIPPIAEADFTATLQAADILLVNERAGLTEMSVPSKLTSYFSTGRPVIAATDASSVTADEVARAGAGPRVDAADPMALLSAAEELGADVEGAAAYGAAGHDYQIRNLGQGAAVGRFREILAELSLRHRHHVGESGATSWSARKATVGPDS